MAFRLVVSILVSAALISGCSPTAGEKRAVEADRSGARGADIADEDRIFSYFDWIIADLGSRHFRVDATKAAFNASYDKSPALKEIIPESIYRALTDSEVENGEAERFRLSLDNLLVVRISAPDSWFAGGEYDAVKKLTFEQASALYSELKENAPAEGLVVEDSPPADVRGF